MDLTKTKTNERRYTSTNILHATADKTIQMNTSIFTHLTFLATTFVEAVVSVQSWSVYQRCILVSGSC